MILRSLSVIVCSVRFNCYRASIGKIKRTLYHRFYPVLLVNPDGSCYNIRFKEPRKIIQLPLDLTTLTEEEYKERLSQRKGRKRKTQKEDRVEDTFSNSQYSFLWESSGKK